MAGSRAERLGSLFGRVNGLLRTGAIKPEDKPLWYDVYAAFPPKTEPKYNRFVQEIQPTDIIYKEDVIRAHFYKTYSTVGAIDMTRNEKTTSQRFVEQYQQLAGSFELLDEKLLSETAQLLQNQGVRLKSFEEINQEKAARMKLLAEQSKTEEAAT